jgi:disulfide bond formation protein DsbB
MKTIAHKYCTIKQKGAAIYIQNFTFSFSSNIMKMAINLKKQGDCSMNHNTKTLENALVSAWGISLIATLGSLYFSEVLKFTPCDLCWFQRIFMYPQVILLGLAVIRKEYGIARYSLSLSIIGGTISLYHYSLQKIPFFQNYAISCGRISCTGQYINWLGFITIPFLALVAFFLISILSIAIIRKEKEGK